MNTKRHKRHISSTPKYKSPPLPHHSTLPIPPSHTHCPHLTSHSHSHSPPLTDSSLEQALLHAESGKRAKSATQSTRNGRREKREKVKKERVDQTPGKERKGKSKKTTKSPQTSKTVSQVVDSSASIRRRYEKGKKISRGETVSFVSKNTPLPQDEQPSCSHYGLRKRKSRDLSFTEENERGRSLIQSLNSSRYGALEHNRQSETPRNKPSHTTPRNRASCKRAKLCRQRWAGVNPLLGYDWIAGLMEADCQLEDKDDGYFEELREYRRVNHSECCRPSEA